MPSKKTTKLKDQLTRRNEPADPEPLYVSTGSTSLNLACTGRTRDGIRAGSYVLLAGDSDSGKTWLGHSILAEAAGNPAFDDYELQYDDIEYGSLMNVKKFFGKKLADRLVVKHSESVERFYDDVYRDIKGKKPFIRIVDSDAALKSEKDVKQFEKEMGARQRGGEASGTMGMEKAKAHSTKLRIVANKLQDNGSILVIIGQLRQNVGMDAKFNPKLMPGGLALKYWSHLVLWTSTRKTLYKQVNQKKKHEQGIIAAVKVKKNRFTGRKGGCLIPIYHSFGIDDIGANVDFLLDEGHWKKAGGRVAAKEFGQSMFREDLCQFLDTEDNEKKLRKIVGEVYREVQKACAIKRRSRYD